MAALERLNLATGFALFSQSDFGAFFENLNYFGTRLAKLQIDTRAVARSLELYHELCEPHIRRCVRRSQSFRRAPVCDSCRAGHAFVGDLRGRVRSLLRHPAQCRQCAAGGLGRGAVGAQSVRPAGTRSGHHDAHFQRQCRNHSVARSRHPISAHQGRGRARGRFERHQRGSWTGLFRAHRRNRRVRHPARHLAVARSAEPVCCAATHSRSGARR